ncbi:MAG: GAF domain-containing sensor histidine kinase [Dissulfurispiraceae bacterium]|nr:GAF domain-containing sensor histidine kinase [Dissulfurispiraceae bacterium]
MSAQKWAASALSTVLKLNNIIGFLPISLDKILNAVADETHALFSSRFCCIYVVDEDNSLKLAAFRSPGEQEPDIHIASGMEQCETLRDNLPYIACGTTGSCKNICPNRKILFTGDTSHVCIPMTTGSDIHGVLSLTFASEQSLSKEKLNVLLSVANLISTAIQRYKLFEKLKNEKAEIERTYSKISSLNCMLNKKIQELEEAQQKLIQSEKLAVTGELTAGLCHEINNPISIILNRIECLKLESEEYQLPVIVLKDLEAIYSYAAKVSALVQDLLIFSKHHPIDFKIVNIKSILTRVLKMQPPYQCKVHVNIPSSIQNVYGDSDRLEQVFINLLSNAQDAMPEGGDIFIKACIVSEFVEIMVEDTGTGIGEEHLDKIFDPFFTTKKIGKGSGLGLSICYGIIKHHGGDIFVKSTQGKGSIFTIRLPLKNQQTTGTE